jgi:hypothetical protein
VFFVDFFNSPAVQAQVELWRAGAQGSKPGFTPLEGRFSGVQSRMMASTQVRMDPFDALQDPANDIAREDGSLRKCMPEEVDGVSVEDELHRALLVEDSEPWEEGFPDENFREELLFHLFRYLCVGGGMCQYEDVLQPYLEVTRALYRDLLSVRVNKNTQAIEVASSVHRILSLQKAGTSEQTSLFGRDSPFNLCFLSAHPSKRVVHIFYFQWTGW